MATHNFKVIIVGGSIAGLSLANMLEQLGIDFLVLEAYPKIAPQVGASIGFFPNGCRILDQIGCYEDIRAKLDLGMTDLYFKSPEAVTLGKLERAGEHFIARHGYDPIFVDRQMAIQVFYDHLQDKSKVIVHKRVVSVEPLPTGVQVTTKDGSIYTGDILVGADGVHSQVRKEMWRLGDELSPDYFPQSDQTDTPCDYTCMFGISSPVDGFIRSSSHSVLHHNHSYLVVDGPGGRIYWFLFSKNERTLHGMENEIPRRFTKEEEKAMAEKYWDDPITETVKFGDLYKNNMSAVLTALPEFVSTKWHFGRITTIGDAVHKFNPISGQGGNSAIETAATLTTEVVSMLKSLPEKASPSNADITAAFQRTQDLRYERVSQLVKAGHEQQALMALETPFLEFMATRVVPLSGVEGTLEMFANAALPARRLPMLPMPKRPRFEPYHDELPAKPLGGNKISKAIAAVVFASLLFVAKKAMWIDPDLFTAAPSFLGAPLKTHYTGIPPLDSLLAQLSMAFADSTAGPDPSHRIQFAHLLSLLFPILLIWTIEGYRAANRLAPTSLPLLFGAAYQLHGLGAIAPLYFLLGVHTTSRAPHTRAIGRPVPPAVAHAVLPAVCLGYAVPTALILLPHAPAVHQTLLAAWQFAPLWVALLTAGGAAALERVRAPGPFDVYAKRDVAPLREAYKVSFWLGAVVHGAFVAFVALTALPTVSFGNVLGVPNPLGSGAAGGPTSTAAEQVFMFAKYDFLFAAAAVALWCLYSVYELRRIGFATTKQAAVAAVAVVVGQVAVGPGATYSGLWYWREGVWAQEANLQGRGDE